MEKTTKKNEEPENFDVNDFLGIRDAEKIDDLEELRKEYGLLAFKYTEMLAMFMKSMCHYMEMGVIFDESREKFEEFTNGKLSEIFKEEEDESGEKDD
ncbi:MAG: hypothetical protein J6Y02_01040 [Pseudobutyrivibrio sp.]|nr:hypothetical protein [Pseudobutyrivibrio sp.]